MPSSSMCDSVLRAHQRCVRTIERLIACRLHHGTVVQYRSLQHASRKTQVVRGVYAAALTFILRLTLGFSRSASAFTMDHVVYATSEPSKVAQMHAALRL